MSELEGPSAEDVPITAFRENVRRVLEREAGAPHSRHVVVLGVDGIPHELARDTWGQAETTRMRSVFPTTSSSAWLSALTGASVEEHGVPGVVFKLPARDGDLVDVFEHTGDLDWGVTENLFSDAACTGYVPVSVIGDLEPYECSWRDLLLRHSRQVRDNSFYTATPRGAMPLDPQAMCDRVGAAIRGALGAQAGGAPCLVWCFVEADRHIHYFGYDAHVEQFLEAIERTATELVDAGAVVIAHSDHGLTPTEHDQDIEDLLECVSTRHGCSLGGAGRARWIYTAPGGERSAHEELARDLPEGVRLATAGDFFAAESLSRSRVGELVLLAEAERFVTSPGYRLDHGSLTDEEVEIPFSVWGS